MSCNTEGMRTVVVTRLGGIRSEHVGVPFSVKNVKCKSKDFDLGAELRRRRNFPHQEKTYRVKV